MGGGGGGKEVTETKPWEGQQPYLRDIFGTAQDIFRQGYGMEYYPGATVAPFSPYTQAGLGMLGQSAMGSPVQGAMGNFLTQSMANPAAMAGVGSDMPGQNPYLDQMYANVAQEATDAFNEQALPGLGAMFGGAGRTGGGIQQQMAQDLAGDLQQNLIQAGADIYGQDYYGAMERDIARRGLMADIGKTGAAFAPAYQGMQQQNIQNLLHAGGMTEDMAQQLMDAERQRFDFYQQAPWQTLGQYSQNVYGLPGGYGTTTAPGQQGSRLAGAAGGAMAGYQMTGNPWGAAAGGIMGAFL